MKKFNYQWTIKTLLEKQHMIEFPEYQREPTVWDLDKKRKLIDSILRELDIASIYVYRREDGFYECIDGRQRINAIFSFLGLNEPKDSGDSGLRYDNNFRFISSDDLFGSKKDLEPYNNKTWKELDAEQKQKILDYEFNVIEMTDVVDEEELNLMFLRLQLGAPLNAGEKLKAMLGEMRDLIFKVSTNNGALGQHIYFEYLNIPKRRFSRELTAAQIAMNFFSLRQNHVFKRARFIDLQEFFKAHVTLNLEQKQISKLLRKRLDEVCERLPRDNRLILKNRAIGITVFFFVNELINKDRIDDIPRFIEFLRLFLDRLGAQVGKGIDIEEQYRDLLKFQTYISQAAVEKYAIENRHTFLKDYFEYYLTENKIRGDA
jgi:hypothetical protein